MKKVDYRERALKIFPWVCASCGRDFNGKNLRELTVHHKDHNYKNNPPDGSNWNCYASTATITSIPVYSTPTGCPLKI